MHYESTSQWIINFAIFSQNITSICSNKTLFLSSRLKYVCRRELATFSIWCFTFQLWDGRINSSSTIKEVIKLNSSMKIPFENRFHGVSFITFSLSLFRFNFQLFHFICVHFLIAHFLPSVHCTGNFFFVCILFAHLILAKRSRQSEIWFARPEPSTVLFLLLSMTHFVSNCDVSWKWNIINGWRKESVMCLNAMMCGSYQVTVEWGW